MLNTGQIFFNSKFYIKLGNISIHLWETLRALTKKRNSGKIWKNNMPGYDSLAKRP